MTIAKHANHHCGPADIIVSGYAWLSTEHLKLVPRLLQNLADKFVGPFQVVAAVSAVSFCLELPS